MNDKDKLLDWVEQEKHFIFDFLIQDENIVIHNHLEARYTPSGFEIYHKRNGFDYRYIITKQGLDSYIRSIHLNKWEYQIERVLEGEEREV